MALSGVTRPNTMITFPGFVMGLLRDKGVQIPGPFHEELVSLIDDKYIRGKARRVSNMMITPSTSAPPPEDEPQPAPPQQVPQSSEAFDFSTLSAWMNQHD